MDIINLAIVGSVSVGKTTAINTFYATTKDITSRKRNTLETKIYDDDILNKHLLTHKNQQKFKLKIYDTPGLNDINDKNKYFNEFEKNFKIFDIIIYIIDIERGFNTDEELNILKFICSLTKKWSFEYNKETIIIPIANKCDEVQEKNGEYNFMDEELGIMFLDIQNTLKKISDDYCINKLFENVIPISLEGVFIYRFLQENGLDAINLLDEKYINKIGINEFGRRKWTMEIINQHDAIKDHFNNKSMDDLLKITTYNKFIMIINTIIDSNYNIFIMNKWIINPIKYSIHNLSDIVIKLWDLEKLENSKNINSDTGNIIVNKTIDMIDSNNVINIDNKQNIDTDTIIYYHSIITDLEILKENYYSSYLQTIYNNLKNKIQNTFDNLDFDNFSKLIKNIPYDKLINVLMSYKHLINYLIIFHTLANKKSIISKYYELLIGINQHLLIKLDLSINDKYKLLNGLLHVMIKYPTELVNIPYFINYLEVSIYNLDKFIQAHFKSLIDHIKKNNIYDISTLLPEYDIIGNKINFFIDK
jgi:small GTP-binding protein